MRSFFILVRHTTTSALPVRKQLPESLLPQPPVPPVNCKHPSPQCYHVSPSSQRRARHPCLECMDASAKNHVDFGTHSHTPTPTVLNAGGSAARVVLESAYRRVLQNPESCRPGEHRVDGGEEELEPVADLVLEIHSPEICPYRVRAQVELGGNSRNSPGIKAESDDGGFPG